MLGNKLQVEQVEIRLFYSNCRKRKFDTDFLEYVNAFDLLVLGGGGLFTVEWDYSETATTIDMSQEFIDGIRIPVIVNAMGYHENTNSSQLFQKFERFISYITSKDNWLVTFRNDGSLERLQSRFGEQYGIIKVPDNAFLVNEEGHGCRQCDSITVGFLITNDLLDEKYNTLNANFINRKIVSVVNGVLDKGYHVMFLNHTPHDVRMAALILNQIPEVYLRSKVTVSPYSAVGKQCIGEIQDYYKKCNCVVSMRFHGNILGMKCKVPMIGLAGHQQIEDLYKELKMEEQLVVINCHQFEQNLMTKIEQSIANEKEILEKQEKAICAVELQSNGYFAAISKFLNNQKGKRECAREKR